MLYLMQLEYIEQIMVQIKFVFLVDQMLQLYHYEYIMPKVWKPRNKHTQLK